MNSVLGFEGWCGGDWLDDIGAEIDDVAGWRTVAAVAMVVAVVVVVVGYMFIALVGDIPLTELNPAIQSLVRVYLASENGSNDTARFK